MANDGDVEEADIAQPSANGEPRQPVETQCIEIAPGRRCHSQEVALRSLGTKRGSRACFSAVAGGRAVVKFWSSADARRRQTVATAGARSTATLSQMAKHRQA